MEFLNRIIIPTVAQESQNNKFLQKYMKNNQIIKRLEFYKTTLNKNLTINDDL